MLLSDLKVAVDGLTILALFLPDLSTVEDFLARLGRDTPSTSVIVVDLVDQVRCMLLGYTKCLTIHLVLLIHSDSLLRLFSSKEALLSLGKVILRLIGVSLLELDASDTFGVVLTSYLNS